MSVQEELCLLFYQLKFPKLPAIFGQWLTSLPGLEVRNCGAVLLPFTDESGRKLKPLASKAEFGELGLEMANAATYQASTIDVNLVNVSNPSFLVAISGLALQVCERLGVPPRLEDSEYNFHYMAFLPGCPITISPLVSGRRLVLLFSIKGEASNNRGLPPLLPTLSKLNDWIRIASKILLKWIAQVQTHESPNFWNIILQSNYLPAQRPVELFGSEQGMVDLLRLITLQPGLKENISYGFTTIEFDECTELPSSPNSWWIEYLDWKCIQQLTPHFKEDWNVLKWSHDRVLHNLEKKDRWFRSVLEPTRTTTDWEDPRQPTQNDEYRAYCLTIIARGDQEVTAQLAENLVDEIPYDLKSAPARPKRVGEILESDRPLKIPVTPSLTMQ